MEKSKLEQFAARHPWTGNILSITQLFCLALLLLSPFVKDEVGVVDWLGFLIAIPVTCFFLLWEYFSRVVHPRTLTKDGGQ